MHRVKFHFEIKITLVNDKIKTNNQMKCYQMKKLVLWIVCGGEGET